MSSEAAWRGKVEFVMAYTQQQAEITERRLRPLYGEGEARVFRKEPASSRAVILVPYIVQYTL